MFDLFPRFILFTTKDGLDGEGKRVFVALVFGALPVSYTHLTLPTIYSV